ncbi:MAG: cation transporter [Deltaproteobacteria bacterium]
MAVRKSLVRLEGVHKVKVTFKPPLAVVTYDPSKVNVEQMIEATTKVGFPSSVSKPMEKG